MAGKGMLINKKGIAEKQKQQSMEEFQRMQTERAFAEKQKQTERAFRGKGLELAVKMHSNDTSEKCLSTARLYYKYMMEGDQQPDLIELPNTK